MTDVKITTYEGGPEVVGATVGTAVTVIEGGPGTPGLSAYEVAVANGFVGTEAEWLESLAAGGGGGAVDSVNAQTGVVVLDAADVGARPDTYVPTWSEVTGKPSTFTPSAHTHAAGEVTGLATVATTGSYADLTGKPSIPDSPDDIGAAATVHTHATADVTGLDAALTGKAATVHTHDDRYYTETEVDTALSGKAASSHTHAQSDVTGLAAALTAKADASALTTHTGDTANPHAVTKAQVGLGNVDNTSDANKPVSTAQAAADALAAQKSANLSDLANASTARTNLGLGTAATHAHGDYDAAGAAAAAQAASQPLDSDLTAIAALTTTSYGRAFLELANAAAGRTALALGTAATSASGDFQPIDSDLTAIAALSTTSYGRSLLEAANAAGARTLLGLGTAATVNTGTASGDVPLLSTGGVLPIARLATGTPDGTKFVRDDGTLATPAGGGSATVYEDVAIINRLTGSFDYNHALPGWKSPASASYLSSTGSAPTANAIYFTPFLISKSSTFDAIGLGVTTAAAGAVARLGIYSSSSTTFYPTTLLTDYGTVALDTTGIKTVTIAATLSPGIYWLAVCSSSATPVFRRLHDSSIPPFTTVVYDAASGLPYAYLVKAASGTPSTSGLPSSAGTVDYGGNQGYGRAYGFLRYDRTV
jgi:hypothetical protein